MPWVSVDVPYEANVKKDSLEQAEVYHRHEHEVLVNDVYVVEVPVSRR